MSWTWESLREALTRLELPEGEYVVGLAGTMLANESVVEIGEAVLLVTDGLYDELLRRGWPADEGLGGLECPSEPGLFVRAGDVSDTYTASIPELIADSWREDGVPCASVIQIDDESVRQFLDGAVVDDEDVDDEDEDDEDVTDGEDVDDAPPSPTWTWERLRAAVPRLELPDGEYVVGVAGALLANESLAHVGEVDLLVTDSLRSELVQRGWPDADGILQCPVEDDLYVRAGDVSDTYKLSVPELISDAWREDGIPFVSMVRVHQQPLSALLATR